MLVKRFTFLEKIREIACQIKELWSNMWSFELGKKISRTPLLLSFKKSWNCQSNMEKKDCQPNSVKKRWLKIREIAIQICTLTSAVKILTIQ